MLLFFWRKKILKKKKIEHVVLGYLVYKHVVFGFQVSTRLANRVGFGLA
jgi:hypothetical protein